MARTPLRDGEKLTQTLSMAGAANAYRLGSECGAMGLSTGVLRADCRIISGMEEGALRVLVVKVGSHREAYR